MLTMIPNTDHTCGNYTRVPPIYNSAETTTAQDVSTHSNVTHVVCGSSGRSRRGRRSNVPLEIREQTRRLKKQNMERKRRACISDKMNALHNLAIHLLGIDPHADHKVEKADILNLCHSVFEGVANIAKEEPELRERLKRLRNTLNEVCLFRTSSSSKKTTADDTSSSYTDQIMPNTLELNHQDRHSYKQLGDHHSYSNQDRQHPQMNTIQSFNTPLSPLSSSYSRSNRMDFCLKADEDNKENKVSQSVVRKRSLNKNYASSVAVTNLTPSLASPPPSSVCSTPLKYCQSVNVTFSHDNRKTTHWQSTPLQSAKKSYSSLNNSDSGYFDHRDYSINGSQSMRLTPNTSNINTLYKPTDIHAKSMHTNDISVRGISVVQSPCRLLTDSTRNTPYSSSSSSLFGENLSASVYRVKD
ncbi:unnamed protein product [Heterobilharzia americana]|nr:unnamed protein product [Heterobilharzia americana]